MTCDSGSRPEGRDVKQARGEARQSGASAHRPNLPMEVTIKQPNLTDAPLPIPSTVTDAERAFKDGFCEGFDHRGMTDDPLEAVAGAERGWKHRAAMQSARTPDTIGIPSVVQEREHNHDD